MNAFIYLSPIIFVIIVTILGFITPGYSHTNHTISRLAIEKFGWIQIINFLQLATGLIFAAKQIATSMVQEESRRIIRIFFSFSASILILTALFPTDPVDNVKFSFALFSPIGMMHIGAVFSFLLVFPFAFFRLTKALQKEPQFRSLISYTNWTGILGFTASIVWISFYVFGIFMEYRGILQKSIVLFGLTWIMTILHRASKARV